MIMTSVRLIMRSDLLSRVFDMLLYFRELKLKVIATKQWVG